MAGAEPATFLDHSAGHRLGALFEVMAFAGADIAVVSKHVGHSPIRVTVDTYSQLLPGVGRSAAEAAEASYRPV